MTDHKPETPRDGWDPERPVVLDNQYVHIDDYDSLLALYRALRQQLRGATANEQSVVTEGEQKFYVLEEKSIGTAISETEARNLMDRLSRDYPDDHYSMWAIIPAEEAKRLRGSQKGEQSLVTEETHALEDNLLMVQQKDALSVANQKLREKGQALLDRVAWISAGRSRTLIPEADALRKAIADTQEGQTGKTVTGKVVMVTGAGLASLIENCQHGSIKFCLLELQQLRASHAALEQAQAGKEPK